MTDDGSAILEVGHVHDLATGGEDPPANLAALCPNCHAMQTRRCNREQVRAVLLVVARAAHARAMGAALGFAARLQ
ncbi:HNH endonuclease [Streptomyces goshikiensis]